MGKKSRRKKRLKAVHPGGIGGTYGGNPVACRAALAVMEIFETENLFEKGRDLGVKLEKRLNEFEDRFERVGDVRGIGPMQAIELVKDREAKIPAADEAKSLVKFCFEKGLIILSCGNFGNVIRFLMPLVITDEQLEKGLAILADGLATMEK